jgi:hypothetical protein
MNHGDIINKLEIWALLNRCTVMLQVTIDKEIDFIYNEFDDY